MRILVTGANGYVGKRLMYHLIEAEHTVIAIVRNAHRIQIPKEYLPHIQLIEADFKNQQTLNQIPKAFDIAFYLLHSLSHSEKEFQKLDQVYAINFTKFINETTCRQVLYLSGLKSDANLSLHLQSRHKVEEILAQASVPLTVFRAGIIIGAGSASFEIIRDLVEKLPIMVAPKWIKNKCQPIAIIDVIDYLVKAMDHPKTFHHTFDIGGPNILSYKEMLLQYAKIRKLWRFIFSIPVLTPRLSSYWLYFVTSTNYQIAHNLVLSLNNNAICKEESISKIIPKKCLTYSQSLQRAFDRIQDQTVLSSWKDALSSGRLSEDISHLIDVPQYGCYIDHQKGKLKNNPDIVFNRILAIGGENGYYMNWAWKIRGFIDLVFGGPGLNRGKTNKKSPEPGDAIDFWRVLFCSKEKCRILLFAEMRLPGEAWLEFKITEENNAFVLHQIATFRPKGVFGRLYWIFLYPMHKIIFKGSLYTFLSAKH